MAGSDAGRVVLAMTDSGPVFGALVEARGGRFTVVTEAGVRESWSAERVFMTTAVKVPWQPVQAAAEALSTFGARLGMLIGGADVAGAWEILCGEDQPASPGALAELMFGDEDPMNAAAAVWAVECDAIHFKRTRDGRYAANGAAAVESMLRARAHEEQEAARMEKVRRAVAGAVEPGGRGHEEDDAVAAGIAWLSALLYDGPSGRDGKRGLKLVELLRGNVPAEPDMSAFDYLVRLGAADPDEIISIRRNRIQTEFPPEVEIEAEATAAAVAPPPGYARLEWEPGAGPLAIDDETTRDVDDALMLERADGATRVHILIADPASVIRLDSEVGRAGLRRASSLYIPTGTVPMFSRTISEGALSLTAAGDRPMLDFEVTLADDGAEIDFRIRPLWGRLEARVTYDEADRILRGEVDGPAWAGTLRALGGLAQALKARRVADGAVILERDEFQVKLLDGNPVVKRIPYDSPGRRLVAEFMILACALAGRFARRNGIPVVFRRQDPPDGDPADRLRGIPEGSRAWYYTMLRTMKRGELTTVPGFHHSLGVVGYTQVTSPLRRFQDFLAHVQIKGFLTDGRVPIDADTLMEMFGALEARTDTVAKVEREARRYWTMKYLQGFCGRQVEGEVVARLGARVLVELDDTGLVLPVSAGNAQPGSRIRVNVREVDPRRDQATLTVA